MLSVILYCYVDFCPINHSDRFAILCLPYVNKFNTTGSQGFYVESAYRSRPTRVAAAGTHYVESFRLVNHQLTASPKDVSRQSRTCLVSSPYPNKDLYAKSMWYQCVCQQPKVATHHINGSCLLPASMVLSSVHCTYLRKNRVQLCFVCKSSPGSALLCLTILDWQMSYIFTLEACSPCC